jgi:hypothetical protein
VSGPITAMLVRLRGLNYRNIYLIFLEYFCSFFENANRNANNFRGLGRTILTAVKIFSHHHYARALVPKSLPHSLPCCRLSQ